MTAFIKD